MEPTWTCSRYLRLVTLMAEDSVRGTVAGLLPGSRLWSANFPFARHSGLARRFRGSAMLVSIRNEVYERDSRRNSEPCMTWLKALVLPVASMA
jgi:hypothetical protein